LVILPGLDKITLWIRHLENFVGAWEESKGQMVGLSEKTPENQSGAPKTGPIMKESVVVVQDPRNGKVLPKQKLENRRQNSELTSEI
jgi:hypothetical protein